MILFVLLYAQGLCSSCSSVVNSETTALTAISAMERRLSMLEAARASIQTPSANLFEGLAQSVKEKLIAQGIDDNETLLDFTLDDLLNNVDLNFNMGEKQKLKKAFAAVNSSGMDHVQHGSGNETLLIARMKGQKLLDLIDEVVKVHGSSPQEGTRILKENFLPMDDLLQHGIDEKSLNSALQRLIDIIVRSDVLRRPSAGTSVRTSLCGNKLPDTLGQCHASWPEWTNWYNLDSKQIKCAYCNNFGCVVVGECSKECNVLIYFLMSQLLNKGADVDLLDQASETAYDTSDKLNIARMQVFFNDPRKRSLMCASKSMRDQLEITPQRLADLAEGSMKASGTGDQKQLNQQKALPWMV